MTSEKTTNPLIGKWFHSFTENGNLHWQGQVIAKAENGFYIVQTYEWIAGAESTQHIVPIAEMTGWLFYSSNEEMKEHYQYHLVGNHGE